MSEEKARSILVVDDDDFTREMYAEVLRQEGYDVREAKDGVEGLDKATNSPPDVIFTGIVMPRMDGFSLMDALKKGTATANIPVLISSHLGREEDRREAEKRGAREFIVRDITPPREIVEIVSRLFSHMNEYRIQFDARALDAQQLARDLRMSSDFQCMECNYAMVIKVRIDQVNTGWYRMKFVCPNCGSQNP